MADNFNMKQFLVENKLGAYSKLKKEGEAAYEYEKGKAAGEKEEKEKLTKEDIGGDIGDAEAEKMMDFLAEYEVIYIVKDGICYRKDDENNLDRVDMSYCRRYAEGKKEKEESFGGINEDILSPEAYDRLASLSNLKAQQAMIKAAEIMMNELTEEGFEVEEVREFFHKLIANDI